MRLGTRAATAGLFLLLAPAAVAQTLGDTLRAVAIFPPSPVRKARFEALLPLRSVRELAALDPTFRRDLATGTLVFRSRTGGVGSVQEPVFVVDGVRRLGGPLGASTLSLLGAPVAPFAAVRRFGAGTAVLGGFVPASIGEAGGGVVTVETDDGTGDIGARVEGISSADAFGTRLASATVRGRITRQVAASVTGEARRTGNAVPSAGRSLRLADDAYARFDATPQTILVRDAQGIRAVPLPVFSGGQPFTPAELRAALGLGPDATIDNLNPRLAFDALTESDLERVRAQDDPMTELALTGQILAAWPGLGRARAGGSVFRREMSATAPTPAEAFGRGLANRDGLSQQTADRASAFAALQLFGPGDLELNARVSHEATGSLLRPAAFSDDVSDALRYGDANDAVFATAQRYVAFSNGRYVPFYATDGLNSGPSRRTAAGFAAPGAPTGFYDLQSAASTQASASLERPFGDHAVSVGGEVEVQTFRRFTLSGLSLATYANDGNGLPTVGFPNGVDRYDQLPFNALRSPVQTYGYTFNGLGQTDGESATDYFPDPITGERRDVSVAPFRPITTAGYVRDQFRVGPVEVDAGLRLERYDARATTLFDPFSTVLIQRAGALPSAPTSIGDDFAVYYANNGASLVGFRDREGQFYDAAGAPVASDLILQDRAGSVRQLSGGTAEGVFAPTRATTRLQPRLSVRALVTTNVSVSAYAMRASRRPDPSLYVPFSAYDQISQQSALQGNADLRPEDVRAAGAGVRVRLSNRATVGAEAFVRRTTDMPEARTFIGGLPTYGGVRNTGRRDEQGLDLTAGLAPINGVEVQAGYTLARARVLNRGRGSFGDLVFDGDAVSPGDTRHALDVSIEARTPASAGLLGGFGVGVVVQAQSGLPYTALQPNTQFSVLDPLTPAIAGEIDGARLPWTVQADVRLEKRLAVGAAAVTAFVWAENALGTRNTLALYRATGQPNADGFAATPNGQRLLDTPGLQALYAGYVGGPVNAGGRQSTAAPFVYGQPRQVRLGVVLGL